MIETTIKKVIWVGRATVFCVGLSVIPAVMLGVSSAALAAVPGDPFRLGQLNAIDRVSQLVGTTTNSLLRIDNNGTGSALQLLVEPGNAPLTVNASAGKATNLDADKLDGNDSAAFLQSSTPTYAVFNSSTGTEGFLAGASASCDPGDKILGGGFDGLSPGDGVIVSDATGSGGSSHGVTWDNPANPDAGTTGDTVTATAVCADFPPLRPPDETRR